MFDVMGYPEITIDITDNELNASLYVDESSAYATIEQYDNGTIKTIENVCLPVSLAQYIRAHHRDADVCNNADLKSLVRSACELS